MPSHKNTLDLLLPFLQPLHATALTLLAFHICTVIVVADDGGRISVLEANSVGGEDGDGEVVEKNVVKKVGVGVSS